jgi:large subunit ribosomal protein L3
MVASLLGRKVGMTRVYTTKTIQDENGKDVVVTYDAPVTVVAAGPCFVSQIKTPEKDGYAAVQIAFEEIKPRRSTMPVIGHDQKAGVAPQRFHREFRVQPAELEGYKLGQELNVTAFEKIKYVDVIGTSKGKGFQGTMKRHNFKGMFASHGCERKHRSPGSISSYGNERGGTGGPKRGKPMAGHMGDVRVTCRSLDVVGIDKDKNLLLIKGSVPGGKNGFVIIRPAKRLYKSKARLAEAAAKAE